MSVTEQTLATIKRFNEVFNQHDVEAVLRLTTEDIVFENTSGGRFEGQAAVGAGAPAQGDGRQRLLPGALHHAQRRAKRCRHRIRSATQ